MGRGTVPPPTPANNSKLCHNTQNDREKYKTAKIYVCNLRDAHASPSSGRPRELFFLNSQIRIIAQS